jgi:23S rRNA (uracil1939-C5)-methyltransferase
VTPKPGDILELTIDSLAYGGQGVARHEGFVLFVRGAVPGDRVRARVTKRKRAHGEARVEELLAPSELRVPATCAHAESCGGCEWQTVDYQTQLEYKQRQVTESLAHIGGLTDFQLEPIRGMSFPWRYRNKMEFSFGNDGPRTVLGLHRRGSWREIVDVQDCWLASERLNGARQAVGDACRVLNLEPYSQSSHEGLLRHLVIREGKASGDLLLNLYVSERFAAESELARRVAQAAPYTSFAVTVNRSLADAAVGEGPFMIAGPPYLREELAGLPLRVPATAFLQTNSEMCGVLYETALRFAEPSRRHDAYDLYCGIGSISLLLAAETRHVHGIELQPEAVAAAGENARLTEIGNVTFLAGDVRKLLKEKLAELGRDGLGAVESSPAASGDNRPAVVVVDPPRSGVAPKALARTAQLGAERLVYVSCNPTTLAANGAQLAEAGYRLVRVAPVDMFPQTHHIEAVALFERQ